VNDVNNRGLYTTLLRYFLTSDFEVSGPVRSNAKFETVTDFENPDPNQFLLRSCSGGDGHHHGGGGGHTR
jgi:hypothetical protein